MLVRVMIPPPGVPGPGDGGARILRTRENDGRREDLPLWLYGIQINTLF